MVSTPERTVVFGACPHDCPDTCSMLVTVEQGRAVKVEGHPEHPFTQGTLCGKVSDYQTLWKWVWRKSGRELCVWVLNRQRVARNDGKKSNPMPP